MCLLVCLFVWQCHIIVAAQVCSFQIVLLQQMVLMHYIIHSGSRPGVLEEFG